MMNRGRWPLSLALAMVLLSAAAGPALAADSSDPPAAVAETAVSEPSSALVSENNSSDYAGAAVETGSAEEKQSSAASDAPAADAAPSDPSAIGDAPAAEQPTGEADGAQIGSQEAADVIEAVEDAAGAEESKAEEEFDDKLDAAGADEEAEEGIAPDHAQELGGESETEGQPADAAESEASDGLEDVDAADGEEELAAAAEELTTLALEEQSGIAAQSAYPTTYQEVYESMIGLKDTYAEGTVWTNYEPYGSQGAEGDAYVWHGGAIKGANSGVGCAAFVFLLSDEAFGDLPATTIDNGSFTYDDVRVGDILRVNGSHFVIVLQKSEAGVTVAEGNYNSSVHWGRALSVDEVMNANFIVTRYPENFVSADEAGADEIKESGTQGSLSWTLTNAGTLTITGTGAMDNFSPNDDKMPTWDAYKSLVSTIIVENGVTSIGDYAFYQSSALMAYIANTITSIGQSAFQGSDLISITLPESVTEIDNSSFRDCANLTSVSVSEGLRTIGENAFRGCTSLQYIDFPSTITSVGAGAFMSCDSLVQARFAPGTGTVEMGDNLFTQCQHLMYMLLPEGLTSLSPGMFQSCTSLYELYIPASVIELPAVDETSPFMSARIFRIYYGGTQAAWDNMVNGNPYLKATLAQYNTEIICDFPYNPFAVDPNDPGDIKFTETDDNEGSTDDSTGDETNPDSGSGSETPSDPSDTQPSNPGGSGSNTGSGSSTPGTTPSVEPSSPAESGSEEETHPDEVAADSTTHEDGTVVTTSIGANGAVQTEVQVSAEVIAEARQNEKPVYLPIEEVQASRDIQTAPSITVRGQGNSSILVAVPVVSPTAGTVAVLVNEDGSADVIKTSILIGDHLVTSLAGGSTIKIIDNSKTFADVPTGGWEETAVTFVTAREILPGTTETTFTPDAPMTRAMMMTVLARLDGADTEDGAAWAIAHGVSDGSDLDGNITNEQLIVMLWNYLGSPIVSGDLSDDTALGQVSDSARDAMRWAVQNGIVDEISGTASNPQQEASRAQAAQVLTNFIQSMPLDLA